MAPVCEPSDGQLERRAGNGMLLSQAAVQGIRKASFVMLADPHVVNNPPIANFKPQTAWQIIFLHFYFYFYF